MTRLNIIVEGQTEETLVNQLLAPHLGQHSIFATARRVLTSRQERRIAGRTSIAVYRGGLSTYSLVKRDIQQWLAQDQSAYVTTMLDLFRLPDDFPNYENARYLRPYERVQTLEQAFKEDISDRRFLPYLQLHEFEALLFSEISKLSCYYLASDQITAIQQLVNVPTLYSGNPELINDDPNKAPSKRIQTCIPQYENDKATAGPQVAEAIGLTIIRDKCQHFDQWLTLLESLYHEW